MGTNSKKKTCVDCAGEGQESHRDSDKYTLYQGGMEAPCGGDGCDEGKVYLSISEWAGIKLNEADPLHGARELDVDVDDDVVEVACVTCSGEGCHPLTCCGCHERIEPYDYLHLGDGEMLCENCGPSLVCVTCEGECVVDHLEVTLDKVTFKNVGSGWDCKRCGAISMIEGEILRRGRATHDLFVYQSNLLDSEGAYYPRLCGDAEGEGCLSEVREEQDEVPSAVKERVEIMVELMPEEANDGIPNMLEDMPWYFDVNNPNDGGRL